MRNRRTQRTHYGAAFSFTSCALRRNSPNCCIDVSSSRKAHLGRHTGQPARQIDADAGSGEPASPCRSGRTGPSRRYAVRRRLAETDVDADTRYWRPPPIPRIPSLWRPDQSTAETQAAAGNRLWRLPLTLYQCAGRMAADERVRAWLRARTVGRRRQLALSNLYNVMPH